MANEDARDAPEADDADDIEDAEFDLFVSSTRMVGFCSASPENCGVAWLVGRAAKTRSKELFPRASFPGNEADVFRHVCWHALMIIEGLPADWVEEFGEQYEIWPDNSDKARAADLANNAFGRRVGAGITKAGLPLGSATIRAEALIRNMVENHGKDLNFDF